MLAMPKMKLAVLMIAAVAACLCAQAQELEWSVDFNTVFNNREGGDEMRPDGTYLFTRLSPEVGVSLLSHGGEAKHKLMGGAIWFQPLTDNLKGYKVLPTLYYQYTARGKWNVVFGMLSRTKLRERLPRYVWSDSMAYHNPNIKGLLVQYEHGARSYAEFFIDWRQLQSENRREAFNVVFDGRRYFGQDCWWIGGLVQYNHLAKRKNAPEDEGVNDDMTINPMVGYDSKPDGRKVSFGVKAGAIVNLERARIDSKWNNVAGFTADASVRWKFLEAEECFYAGKDLFPLYPRFGSQLNMGDTYYRDKIYSRTDLRAHIVQTAFVDLEASVSFHATDKVTGFWQQVACRFYIDSASRGKGKALLRNNY